MMIFRKGRKAQNVFYKMGSPVIQTGERSGQRESERITAQVQVISDDAFNAFGDRLLNGFTVEELEGLLENGGQLTIESREGITQARVAIGQDEFSFTRGEIQEIIDQVKETGIQTLDPPLGPDDYENIGKAKAVKEGKENASRPNTSGNGPKGTRKANRSDSAA